MILWLDAHISPRLAQWVKATFQIDCFPIRNLGLRHADDLEIFRQAREAGAVLMTKDEDFVRLVERQGAPPQVIWVTSGNMPNSRFRPLLQQTLPDALSLIANGEPVVEIQRDAQESSKQSPLVKAPNLEP